MAYLYKSFCYSTMQEIADQIKSNLVLDGFGLVNNAVSMGSSITIQYKPTPATFDSPLPDYFYLTYSFVPPVCTKLGFSSNFSGLDKKDSILIAESVVAVLILAWTFKVVSRSL